MRKWIPLVLIALSLAGSALLLPYLPEMVEFKLDGLFPVTAEADSGPRWQLAFLMPLTAFIVWLVLRLATTESGAALNRFLFGRWVPAPTLEPTAFDRFRPTYDFTVTLVVSFVLLFHFTVLGLAAGGPAWLTRAFTAVVGLGMMALGNVMPRVRPNAVMGVRTIRTLNDPLLWARVHRLLGSLVMVSGLVMVGLTLVAPRYALSCGMAGLLVAFAVVFFYTTTWSGQRSAVVLLLVCVALSAWDAVAVAQTPVKADTIVPADVTESALVVQSGTVSLNGTLALPARRDGRVPVAIIVAGSGPTDRNGNGPLAQTNMYRQLAWQLAQQGIASYRYDKRGMSPTSVPLDHWRLTTDDFVGDVVSAARMVKQDARFGPLFLIGHSEGAQLVVQAANRGAPADGVVMASGMGRRLAAVLHDQFVNLVDSAQVADVDSSFQKFLRGEAYGEVPVALRAVFVPVYRVLLNSMAAYDAVAEIRAAKQPLLIVHGGMDLQTPDADANRLRAARPDATYLLIPAANHVFKHTISREVNAQLPSYHDLTMPIVPELAPGIGAWILGIANRGSRNEVR